MQADPGDSLDLDADAFRRAGHALVELMAEALEADRNDPVLAPFGSAELDAALGGALPREGMGFDALLDELRRAYLPFLRRNGHPRLFAYVQASADPLAALVDGLASVTNQNVTAWRSSPGATRMEHVVVAWLDAFVGFDGPARTLGGEGGFLTSGGSAANAVGLACALRRCAAAAELPYPAALARMSVYRSSQAHLSCDKALRTLGLEGGGLREVAVDARRRMQPADLARRITRDRARGRLSAAVFASAGTANDGTIDPLLELAQVCAQHGVWLHVDGAYGAPAAATDEYAWLRQAFARADSLSIDPHKWLFAPLDVGCILVRDPRATRAAFAATSEYVEVEQAAGPEAFAFFALGPELSRRARALKVWALFRLRGADRLARIIARNCALRRRIDARVEREPRLESLGSGLSITTFRYRPPAADAAELERLNRAILERLLASGRFLLSPTTLDGRFALRVCIVNFRTTEDDVDALVDAVLAAGAELSGG